jgi:hypothetical protein
LSVTCRRTVVFSTNKTDRHDITKILLKVALNTINQTNIMLDSLSYLFISTLSWPHHVSKKEGFGPYNYFNPATCYCSACSMSGKSAVLYLCVRDNRFKKNRFCIFLRYFFFIFKLLQQCDILCFSSFHFITEIWRIISYQACIRCYLGILSICTNCKHRVCIYKIVEVLSIHHGIVWSWVLIKGSNKRQWYIVINLL